MATSIQQVDIRLMLSRLRPGAVYGWRGSGDFGNALESVDWRDTQAAIPTEAEIIAEWDVYQTEEATREAVALDTVTTALAEIAAARALIAAGQVSIAADINGLAGTPAIEQVAAALTRNLEREALILDALNTILNRQEKIVNGMGQVRERVR